MPKKNTLNKGHQVTKSNVLNEMRADKMSLQELRLFTVYLSRINPLDPSTRHVKFTIEEFQEIMELGRMNIPYYKKVANNLLSQVIILTTKSGGFDGFNLFSQFKLEIDKDNKWYIDIIANDKAMPFLFEFKNHYFKYELWNALHLKRKSHLRLYEVLKQYERIGYRVVSVSNLRHWLGIEDHEYERFA